MTNNISANTVTANQVNAERINARTFGGLGGGGTVMVTDRIILGGWVLEAATDGIYVTTPSGIRTKMELIDFRETPVPPTAKLLLTQDTTDDPVIAANGGDTVSI